MPVEPRDARPPARRPRGRTGRPSTAGSPTWPSCSARATCWCVNDTRVRPARLALRAPDGRRRRGAAARAATATAGGRRWCARAGGCAPGTLTPVDRRRRPRGGGGRRPRGRAPPRPRSWPAIASRPPARCRCRRTSTSRSADPERYQTVYARRPGVGRRAHGRPPPHRGRARARAGPGASSSPPSSSPSASTRSVRSRSTTVEDHPMHSEAYAVPAATLEAVEATRPPAAPWSRSAPPWCGRWSRRRRPATAEGRTDAVHHARLPLPRRRSAPHELPRAAHDPAGARRRLRRPPVARPLRRGPGRPVPLPLLRRRHAPRRGTTGGPDPSRRRRRRRRRPGHDDHDASGGPSSRRASCRSAPAARCEPSMPTTCEALGAQVVLGQHLPPDAQPGRRRRGRRSGACTGSRAGTGTCSPTRAGSRCSASTRAAT